MRIKLLPDGDVSNAVLAANKPLSPSFENLYWPKPVGLGGRSKTMPVLIVVYLNSMPVAWLWGELWIRTSITPFNIRTPLWYAKA